MKRYDSKAKKYEVHAGKIIKFLPRLSVRFAAEDRKLFEKRVARCKMMRKTAYSLRRSYYVFRIAVSQISPLTDIPS